MADENEPLIGSEAGTEQTAGRATVSAEEDAGLAEPGSEEAAVSELAQLLESRGVQLGRENQPGSAAGAARKPDISSASQATAPGGAATTPAEAGVGSEEKSNETEEEEGSPSATSVAATGEEAPEALDLSQWDLPAETAAQIQESFNRAMGRKHRAVKAARERAESAEAEVSELQEQVQTLRQNPAAAAGATVGVGSQAEVAWEKQIAGLESALRVIEENPDGYTGRNAEGQEVSYTAPQLREARRTFERQLSRLENRLDDHREARAAQVKQFEAAAVTEHPWLKNPKHASTVAIAAALEQYPVLAAVPGIKLIMARAMAWRASAQAQSGASALAPNGPAGLAQPAAGTPAAKPQVKVPPKITTRPAGAARAMPSTEAKQEAAWKALENNPNDQTAVALLATLIPGSA